MKSAVNYTFKHGAISSEAERWFVEPEVGISKLL